MDLDAAPYEYRQTAYRPTAVMLIVSGVKKYQSTTSGKYSPSVNNNTICFYHHSVYFCNIFHCIWPVSTVW